MSKSWPKEQKFIVQAGIFLVLIVKLIVDAIADNWRDYGESIGLIGISCAFFFALLFLAFQCIRTKKYSKGLGVTTQIIALRIAISLWQSHHIVLSLIVMISLPIIILGVFHRTFIAK